MAAIKFSKQYIEPNPNEIDYWVDLSSNQYGGRMKYYNGFEWVDLVNPDGTHIDINDFYNKLQINQMLSQKASVDSVESKVDDDEVSDVIKNISFSQRGEDGVEMVMFKYDDTTVGIQLPIADNTKSGIITKDTFKNLVNQTQLQQLYSEMYAKLSEIRNNYQPKLRAGANIKIENNVISAVSKISADWNDIANKPDIYDKSQVDTMMSGVYKIKGSRRFEALPLYTNTVGDTYNITNDFSLHGEDYPLGTNVVWTENGWDALAGIFDTSELEEDIQEVKDNYLPLSGGKMSGGLSFDVNSSTAASNPISFISSTASGLLYLSENTLKFKEGVNINKLWHSGNDGHESGLDADLLDGKHSRDFYNLTGGIEINATASAQKDLNNFKTPGTFFIKSTSSTAYVLNIPIQIAGQFFVKMPTNSEGYVSQEYHPYNSSNTYWRNYDAHSGTWSTWKLKTTDLERYTAPSATKLATPVKLWGAYIDGTQNYGGSITLMSNTAINGTTEDGKVEHCLIPRWSDGKTYFNFGSTGLVVRNNNSDIKMVISPDGNMGIGTTNPQYKLDVNDTARIGGFVFHNHNEINAYNDALNNVPTNLHLNYRSSGEVTIAAGGGNVGIGTSSPQYKLEVNGAIYSNDGIGLPNGKYYQLKDANGTSCGVLSISGANQLIFGYGTAARGYDTYLLGNSLLFKVNTTNLTSMVINSSGNVTIGEADLAGTNDKLYVKGTTVVDGYVYCKNILARNGESAFSYSNYSDPAPGKNAAIKISGDLYQGNGKASFNGQITSGDLVDWYGVSWSENSSDPTCTRIGNMALHRSLPILNAMKGYYIGNLQSACPECMLPLNDDWSELHYNMTDNGKVTVTPFVSGNIMVKIPEFWYIDEYDGTTKTHNLKISQSAKAGWCHHKEAYAGAYEGYDDGSYYRSAKDYIPTVSVTREAIRTAARANGYEDEYKWNIYTYEEHRAICHLFLVEYATRNSQAPVNTALTADGFKQGGLGSGCTTGTVKINGVDTYSFIPTGTTDSLGNGSGQVAYTVTQTDADGNEIDTVTRYANRYRGIENPFGHIWKHVDDIVNVYNAETTYKTVYKCDKPEHFATNKNAKYKPLCSFPGGSKMQGWSKEIKATINCDFFKSSVGGNESTYWCDYNYDNDDTSEHCLLIGGYSGNGGGAGLFYFALSDGVGYSAVHIGSRLTYLPWAE